MKKLTAILLTLAMLLGMGSALAEDVTATLDVHETLDITVDLPAGFTADIDRADTALYAIFSSPAEDAAAYLFSIAYSDLTGGPTPGEMTKEDQELAMQMIAADFFNPSFEVKTAPSGTKFLLIDENDAEVDYAILITNYEGYFVQMYIAPAIGTNVGEAQVTEALEILASIEVINK